MKCDSVDFFYIINTFKILNNASKRQFGMKVYWFFIYILDIIEVLVYFKSVYL